MAKKASKPKAQYGWVYAPTASAMDKLKITARFQSFVDELKSNLPPLQEPLQFNQIVDVFSKWRGNNFYIIHKYKCGAGAVVEGFDAPLARLEFYSEGKFNLSAHRHNGQWMPLPMCQNISTEEAIEAIKNDPWFET